MKAHRQNPSTLASEAWKGGNLSSFGVGVPTQVLGRGNGVGFRTAALWVLVLDPASQYVFQLYCSRRVTGRTQVFHKQG